MENPTDPTHFRQQSDLFIAAARRPNPLPISPWVAMSLLQKAIRRGEGSLALMAASTLLHDDPDKLWRRIGGIAYEDVGLADLRAMHLANSIVAGIRFRRPYGGEWEAAASVVSLMSSAAKCRGADDLLMSAQLHPAFKRERRRFGALQDAELRKIAKCGDTPQEKALALWFLAGTNRWSARGLAVRKGDYQKAIRCLRDMGGPPSVIDMVELGYLRTRSILPIFVGLLSISGISHLRALKDDGMPAGAIIDGVPSWAFDLYSREGRRCLDSFLQTNTRTASWVRRYVFPPQQVAFLGSLVFRVEGQRCRKRLRWAMADQLRAQVDTECHGPEAIELLGYAEADLPTLNEVRIQCLSKPR